MTFAIVASPQTATTTTATVFFAAWHRVLAKPACPVLQIGAQNLLSITGQKGMNFDTQLLEIRPPPTRQRSAQQCLSPLKTEHMALLVNAQAPGLANFWLAVRIAEADQLERFGRFEERGYSLATKWNGDFHDRGNDCDRVFYASDVPGHADKK